MPDDGLVTVEDARAWAQSFLDDYANQQPLTPYFDIDTALSRASQGLGLSEDVLAEVLPENMRHALMLRMEIKVRESTCYDKLRVRTAYGRRSVLFRWLGDGSEDDQYHEWILEYDDQGDAVAVDLDVYESGQLMSNICRHVVLGIAKMRGVIQLEDLSATELDAFYTDAVTLDMQDAFRRQHYRQIFDLYDKLSSAGKLDARAMIMVFQAHHHLGNDAAYEEARAAFSAEHADSNCHEVVQFRICMERGDYEEALRLLNLLDERLGGDPYSHAWRAFLLSELRGYEAAQREIDIGLDADRTQKPIYQFGTALALRQQDWPRTAELLELAVSQQIDISWLELMAGVDAFKQSEPYRRIKDKLGIRLESLEPTPSPGR